MPYLGRRLRPEFRSRRRPGARAPSGQRPQQDEHGQPADRPQRPEMAGPGERVDRQQPERDHETAQQLRIEPAPPRAAAPPPARTPSRCRPQAIAPRDRRRCSGRSPPAPAGSPRTAPPAGRGPAAPAPAPEAARPAAPAVRALPPSAGRAGAPRDPARAGAGRRRAVEHDAVDPHILGKVLRPALAQIGEADR